MTTITGAAKYPISRAAIARSHTAAATIIPIRTQRAEATPPWSMRTISQPLSRNLVSAKVNVVGHSYGALTALFLAQKHPELVRTLVLAEPPAISLLATMSGDDAAKGKAMFADIQRHVVAPMRVAFSHGDREAGVATFIDYVFGDAAAWQKMSPSSRKATMRDAHEWDVTMTTGTLFPALDPSSVRHIMMPVLLLSGAKTYPFLRLIDEDLAHLLPDNRNFVLSKSGHQMWYQQTADTRGAVEAFLRVHGRGEAAISP